MWFLAPPKHWTRLPCAVPVEKMYSAIADEPTKPIALTRESVSSASTASLSPLTTLSTPSGSPALRNSSPIRSGTEGSRSDGLRMNVLPQAIAGAHFHSGIIAGKLNGVMPATTPSGWRMEKRSIPGPAPSVNSPFIRCGMPQANSTTSSPRWMSPLESAKVLPCSEESSLARLSNSLCASSRNLNRTRARRCGLVAAQAGCAAAALAMACSTSALLAKATFACTSPVLGLNTSPLRPERPETSLPPMKWPISRMAVLRKLKSRPCRIAVGRFSREIAQLAPCGKPETLNRNRYGGLTPICVFTRVHSPSKTGVNALLDALWRVTRRLDWHGGVAAPQRVEDARKRANGA